MFRDRSLRFQLSVAIVGLVVTSVLFVWAGTYTFVAWGEHRFFSSLSAEAQAAYMLDWSENDLPAPHLVREISIAEETILAEVYQDASKVVAILSTITILVGGAVGIGLARRLTAPLEAAASSARTIAEGEFSHRMSLPDSSSREVHSLVTSFVDLATSLEQMEQNLQFTSASIAHEIRTPLTVVQGYLQGIRDGVFEASDEQLDLMLRRMDTLGRLIDDLKTLSLADAGRLRLEPETVQLGRRLTDLVAWIQESHADREIHFEEKIGSQTDVTVTIDAGRIEQVVLGLIHNALTYSGDHGCVSVRLDHRGDEVVITVTDDGPGFSDEALKSADERFWRDETSRSRETGGSGLGLAVAKAIVEAHDGALELANLPMGGGSVQIRLPRHLHKTSTKP